MALARFFDKAALAAAAVLQGFNREAFEEVLARHTLGIRWGEDAASSAEGRVCLELSVNLLARLYPRIALIGPGEDKGALAERLRALALSTNPRIEITDEAASMTACVVIGRTADPGNAPAIYVGSDGWLVQVSSRDPVGVGASDNPFGAAAAACFGAANVFRMVFADQLPQGAVDQDFRLSLLDLDPAAAQPANPELGRLELRTTHLVGAGAIGNAAVWALARVPGLTGTLHAIDGERVDATNPQRYVLSAAEDIGIEKVALAVREMERTNSGLQVHAHPRHWGRFLAEQGDKLRLGLVAVALDSAHDRIAVQASLPERIVNAWTQPGDLGISRHDFPGEQACLACLYLPEAVTRNEDEIVSAAIGLPDAFMEVRHLLHTGAPIGEPMIRRIIDMTGADPERLLPFAGRSIRDFYVEAVCAGALMQLGSATNGRGGTEVPLAFQSALAGVLLAAALVGESAGLAAPASTKVVIDLLRPLGTCLGVPLAKHPSGRCMCQDPDFLEVYRERQEAALVKGSWPRPCLRSGAGSGAPG